MNAAPGMIYQKQEMFFRKLSLGIAVSDFSRRLVNKQITIMVYSGRTNEAAR